MEDQTASTIEVKPYYSATATVVSGEAAAIEHQWLQDETATYETRSKISQELMSKASKVLPSGVASCYHRSPTPFFVDPEKSKGAHVVDVDGNSYIDFHAGYGVTALGHQHPKLMEAWSKVISTASISGVTSPDAMALGEKLVDRFGLPFWRFMNSGTEATLDSIRLARALNGRKYIIKPEASYHGHHDAVWVSVDPVVEEGREEIPSVPFCSGIPSDIYNLTRVVEFNNIESLRAVMQRYKGEIAGIILEPIMLNCGVIKATNEYMAELFRLCHEEDVVVIFDLVKIGLNLSMKHLSSYPTPDVITLGKALGGGYPIGAVGMTDRLKTLIEERTVMFAGTFNGGSYAMKIASTVLDILNPAEQERIENMSSSLAERMRKIIAKYQLPAHVVNIGNKGCTFVQNEVAPVHNYREFAARSNRMLEQILPVFFQNRGLWVQWKDEWTISAQHQQEHLDALLQAFEEFAQLWVAKHKAL